MNTPIPDYVSFPLSGVEGSLTSETLNWMKVTKKLKNGKTAGLTRASVGCKNGKRPYSDTFTAERTRRQPQSAHGDGHAEVQLTRS